MMATELNVGDRAVYSKNSLDAPPEPGDAALEWASGAGPWTPRAHRFQSHHTEFPYITLYVGFYCRNINRRP